MLQAPRAPHASCREKHLKNMVFPKNWQGKTFLRDAFMLSVASFKA